MGFKPEEIRQESNGEIQDSSGQLNQAFRKKCIHPWCSFMNFIWETRKGVLDLCTSRYYAAAVDLRQPGPYLQCRCDVPVTYRFFYIGKRDLHCAHTNPLGTYGLSGNTQQLLCQRSCWLIKKKKVFDPTLQCGKSCVTLSDGFPSPSKDEGPCSSPLVPCLRMVLFGEEEKLQGPSFRAEALLLQRGRNKKSLFLCFYYAWSDLDIGCCTAAEKSSHIWLFLLLLNSRVLSPL